MHVAVVGAGPIGTLFAGYLGTVVDRMTIVGRPGPHLDAIDSDGIRIETGTGTNLVTGITGTPDHETVADADWLLLAVKSYDTASAMADVEPSLDDTPVLTIQNGLDNAETIAEYVPRESIIAGTTTHGATKPSPGTVDHAGTGATTIGRYFASNDATVNDIAETLTAAGIQTSVTDRPRDAVWEKVLVNVGINAATALARVPNGELVHTAAGERLVERAVQEGVEVAQAVGRTIPEDVGERAKQVARRTADNRSSMLQDLESGSRTEIDALNGAIVDRGRVPGVPTPINETLTDLVRLAEQGGEE